MPVGSAGLLPVIVVGGGIGGAATALALSRKGRSVVVLEQTDDLTEIGAGIQMPPNAFKAFHALGVLEAVQAVAAYPERLVLGDMITGEPVYQSPIGEAFVDRFGYRYALMHRGDLLQILVDACRRSPRIELRTRSRVTDFEDLGDRVVVRTATGDAWEGTAMVAADGLWSATRGKLFEPSQPRTDGYIVCRGVVPVDHLPEALYSQSVTMWGGPGLDLFHYPLRRGEIYNIGASYRDPDLVAGVSNPKGDRDVMMARFAGACRHVRDLLRYIDVSRAWVLYDRPAISRWTRGRVALLGDAAHPTTIYISQGACMALEDAVVIAEAMSRTEDVAEAFRAYETARHLRTARVQLTSRQFGEVYHAGGVERDLRNHLLAGARPEALHDALAWVFGGAGDDCLTTAAAVA
ncbi:MAG: FAD-dependent oxidoreductase [Hyphomicrobiaceae bacterium]|nr:FAD-dependent oxidoreductase [Hyphomicrobiaceae bacterium]